MTAAESIAHGIGGRFAMRVTGVSAAEQIAKDLGAKLARTAVQTTRLGTLIRQLDRAQRLAIRRRDWIAAIKAAREAGVDLQHLRMLHALARVGELAELAEFRTIEARAQRRRRPPRGEHHPVRGRRCSRAPNDVSSLPLCPGVAA